MFTPTAEKLMPDLTPREELVVLARALWREGYNDHLAGHITVNLGDGTLLCNPWLLTWAELRPAQVLRIDLDGQRASRATGRSRSASRSTSSCTSSGRDVGWAVHNHPLFGTVWADLGRAAPDPRPELGARGRHAGPGRRVRGAGQRRRQRAGGPSSRWAPASMALLAGHGVFVLGGSARAVHQRAVALEQRCQHAWYARAAGGSGASRVPQTFLDLVARSDGEGFLGFWEAAVRAELAADPGLLD